MKYLSFRLIFLGIFLPPVLYILSLQALEKLIQMQWTADLQKVLISDSSSLLEGRARIQEEIQGNIELYLSESLVLKLGVVPRIIVSTREGRRLYPQPMQKDLLPSNAPKLLPEHEGVYPLDFLRIAQDNLKVLNEGINLSVAVNIPRNSWLADSVLIFYIFLSSLILFSIYGARVREAERLNLRNQQEVKLAADKLASAQESLRQLSIKEKEYQDAIQTLETQVTLARTQVESVENEALKELEIMEENLQESIGLREEMESEVAQLRQELERLQSAGKGPSRRLAKQVDSGMKRFKALYKNLEFHPRAVEGFLGLQSGLQLKAEELIHTINEDSGKLSVKRKVFSKKGVVSVFESDFAYRGRIYWKHTADNKVQILAIGTKNTQAKELAFLESLQEGI